MPAVHRLCMVAVAFCILLQVVSDGKWSVTRVVPKGGVHNERCEPWKDREAQKVDAVVSGSGASTYSERISLDMRVVG